MPRRKSSDEQAPQRLTPEMLADCIAVVDASNLARSGLTPHESDHDLAEKHHETFGNIAQILVSEGEVFSGWEHVAAAQNNGGRVAVVDLTALKWPSVKVAAAAEGLRRMAATATVDTAALAELLLNIESVDNTWLEAIGWGSDDFGDLLLSIEDTEAVEQTLGSLSNPYPTLQERQEKYDQSGVRSIVLAYPTEQFRWMTETLDFIRQGDEPNSAVVLRVIAEASGSAPPDA